MTSSEAQAPLRHSSQPAAVLLPRVLTVRWFLGVLALAAAYYIAGKIGQSLRYTGSVAAIWPPAGVGIAALYLWGLSLWPGIALGELILNVELHLGSPNLPLESIVGQQIGNMLEILVGAALLARLAGRRAKFDRVDQVTGMLIAVGIATAISATVGTVSMLAGGVIDFSETPSFWRTWWLGDTAGGLVVVPLVLAWAFKPDAAWHRMRSAEGVLMVAAVAVLTATTIASSSYPLTYIAFPALIWAALRFGPPGSTVAVAIVAALTIGITAHHVGPFSKQTINDRALSTQLYIAVAALTTLFLSAVVAERRRSVAELAEARLHEGQRALEERHRIARDLHDSVSQTLFSILLRTRTAQKAVSRGSDARSMVAALATISSLTRSAQNEMRSMIFQLRPDPVENGIVAAVTAYANELNRSSGVVVVVDGPTEPLPLTKETEGQLYAIGREALNNVLRHASASAVSVRIRNSGEVVSLEVRDDGQGFDPTSTTRTGHFGLDSMHSRAEEIGGVLSITPSAPHGTTVRVDVLVDPEVA